MTAPWTTAGGAAVLTFLGCGLTIWLARTLNIGIDRYDGVQKLHVHPVPRLGGIPLFATFTLICFAGAARGSTLALQLWSMCLLPFAVGLVEDVSGRAGVLVRLAVTLLAATYGALAYGLLLHRVDVPGLDYALRFLPLGIAFTVVASAGIPHAINLIDGCNGLAASVSAFILCALGAAAVRVADAELALASFIGAGAIIGFLAWNFPFGRMFLGDSGSYFTGFLIADLSLALLARHPHISAWFPLALVIYPVWETLYSAWRRGRVGARILMPDLGHLHQLIYARVRRLPTAVPGRNMEFYNSLSSVPLMAASGTVAATASLVTENPLALFLLCATFAVGYCVAYPRLELPSLRTAARRRAYSAGHARLVMGKRERPVPVTDDALH